MSRRKSKSLNSLLTNYESQSEINCNRAVRESSAEVYIINDTLGSNDVVEDTSTMADSGIGDKKVSNCDILTRMEQKIDNLNDLFLEQCKLLSNLKEEVRNYKQTIHETEQAHVQILADLLKKAISQSIKELNLTDLSNVKDEESIETQPLTLSNAIETKKTVNMDKEVTEALIKLLQSGELRDQMVHATAVKDVIGTCLPGDFSNIYLPILERSHGRLVRQIRKVVKDAFIALEDHSACLSRSILKTSRMLHRALGRRQSILEATSNRQNNVINTSQYTLEESPHKELKEWRKKDLDMLCGELKSVCLEQVFNKISPQPTIREYSILDQLIISVALKQQINDGDINDAFERALSASNLSFVMFACRAADPIFIFTQPCKLKQNVLLSLMQQLSTDIVHDTQLKCRYLEDAIINLNTSHPDTRSHLPLVVNEVQKHLKKFTSLYPNHVANRRVTLIVMAASNLLQ